MASGNAVMKDALSTTYSQAEILLNSTTLNKGTAFNAEERARFGLDGRLPPQIETLEEQVHRAYEAFGRKNDDLERHIYLRALQDTNEVLFYRVLLDHLEEMLPIIYTPVVAQGCRHFSQIYRRPRGLFIPYTMRNSIRSILRSRQNREADVIIATDGERILGIGDQGVGGMGISIGKLSLYTVFGGVHPMRTLPVVLDVGTNNPKLLEDPEYLGWRHERVSGDDYFEFISKFVDAVRDELPGTVLHWEDLSTQHARTILGRYRTELPTYNDDIQGTAAVTLATVLAAVSASGRKLADQHVVFLGAGSSVGVADYLRAAMVTEGLSDMEARRRMWIVDVNGLLHSERADLSTAQSEYAQPVEATAGWSRSSLATIGLQDVIRNQAASILIGLSTSAGAFTEDIVREMASKVERPIILPLSNPTSKSEAIPEDLIRWTSGRALVATGSPFPPVVYEGRLIPIAQCNNVYIFPGIGLAVAATAARRITDKMVLAAAYTLSELSPARKLAGAPLLPALTEAREIAVEIAVAVGRAAQAAGVAETTTVEELRRRVLAAQWTPQYPVFE